MIFNNKKFEKGVSIIEIVIVTAIVGMISVLLVNLPASLRLIGQSSHESVANQIAVKKIEDLRSQGYDNLANGTSQISDTRLSQLPSQTSSIVIEDCPVSICTNSELIKKVTINITWKEDKGNKSTSINTLISKGGLQ